MLSDYEAADNERRRKAGVNGPVVLTWIDRLLEDRKERIQQFQHVRQRLKQAFQAGTTDRKDGGTEQAATTASTPLLRHESLGASREILLVEVSCRAGVILKSWPASAGRSPTLR
jgi:hypothetical protein